MARRLGWGASEGQCEGACREDARTTGRKLIANRQKETFQSEEKVPNLDCGVVT